MSSQAAVPIPAPVHPQRTERLLTRAFVMLGVSELAYFTAAGVAIYTLPMYVTGPIGSGSSGAGLAFGAFAISALLLRPLAGRLSDTRGRRPLLLAGSLLCAVAMFLTAHAEQLGFVVALRLVLGVAEAAFFVAAFAALADLAPPNRVGEALSYSSLGLYLGLAMGPPLGELLVRVWGFTTAWYGASLLALLAATAVLRLGETRPDRPSDTRRAQLIHRAAIPPSIGFFASVAAMGGFLAFAPLQAAASGLHPASLPLVTYGTVVVAFRVLFARVPDRLPPLPLGACALLAISAGLATLALWTSPAGLLLGTGLLAGGVAFSTPAFFSAVFATARPSERGAAAATASVSLDLGLGGGPILFGAVAQTAGIPWAFGTAAGTALLGCAWTASLVRLPAPRRAETQT